MTIQDWFYCDLHKSHLIHLALTLLSCKKQNKTKQNAIYVSVISTSLAVLR